MHGSQCGFCTPGFVMALFALYHAPTRAPVDRDEVNDWIAGNLCRCTGYRPIVDAALAACAAAADDRFRRGSRRRAAQLAALHDERRRLRRHRASASSPRPPRIDGARRRSTCSIRTRRSSPARPTSGCGSPSSCATCRRSSSSAASRGLDRSRTRRDAISFGAAVTLRRRAMPYLAAIDPRSRRTAAPLRRQAGAQRRHGRRQHRQRLADRRHAAGADRARRDAACCSAASERARCRWRISSSTTASRTARPGEFVRVRARAEVRRRRALPLLQDLQALRPGHLRRHGRVQLRLDGDAHRRARASPSAAWRRTPKRARAPRRR